MNPHTPQQNPHRSQHRPRDEQRAAPSAREAGVLIPRRDGIVAVIWSLGQGDDECEAENYEADAETDAQVVGVGEAGGEEQEGEEN